ncbi:MAG: hypothetical protein QGF71_07615 [Rhodospirillales bacterium]|nr:hypothetical protein [Rhodospirillales bacterium]
MDEQATTRPSGWRAKFGVIIPTENTITEPEFNAMKPEGVTVHFTRMPIHFHPEEDEFKSLLEDLDIRLVELRACAVNVVAYNCTVGSMACPADILIGKLKDASGAKAVSTTCSVMEAFEALGVNRIALATPYSTQINAHEIEYFSGRGIEVAASVGMDFDEGPDIGLKFAAVTAGQICDHVRSADRSEAQAIFISCANFGSASIVQMLEEELGKPVITSNIATFWAGLRAAGIEDSISGYGRLLAEH